MRRILLLATFMTIALCGAFAQGITTASISGVVADSKGAGLPGANVIAVHTPSGTQYGTSTREDGRFTIPNARVGGPYKLTVSFIGYENQEKNEIYLSLGNTSSVSFQLAEAGTQLEEILVSGARQSLMNPDRTGAATNVDSRTITSVPTINRGLRDFTKLSPLANTAGNGTSFAGSNNRYNQFAIDGLVNNDVFGLAASGTNGGQTGVEPISLDAIEEFQLNVAPYDVRQGGFTGGGINAVTRSGSNTFQGSAYYFGNNESLVGGTNPNTHQEQDYPEYKDYQTGFRLGGPIMKNKLFFFVSGEITRQKTPLAFIPGTPESNVTLAEIQAVESTLATIAPGYDPGEYINISDETNSDKILAKIDWNINDKHKLSIRHSYTFGEQIDNSRNANQVRFYNNGLYFPSKTNSTGIELNSIFGTKYSNRLLIGYTQVRDDRDPLANPFPFTTVNIGSGRSIVFGSENSSVANQLDQDNFTLTDDFTIFKGKHIISVGTHNEFYKFYNIFVQNIYGNYGFSSLANFQSQATGSPIAPSFYQIGYSFDGTDDPSQSKGAADFSAFQLGFYAQDEFQVNDKLKVTGGLRIDIPIFPDSPLGNDAFNAAYPSDGQTGTLPDSKLLIAPRVGFNYDVMGDRSLQIRGGAGVFTGRVPFVWVSNQFTNNGQVVGGYSVGSGTGTPLTNGVVYNVDPYNQPIPGEAPIAAVTPSRGDINVIDPDFKFPQVFRTNLAVDKRLPWGLIGTIEGIFSKTYNNVNFNNLNRQEDGAFTWGTGVVDTRPRYTSNNASPTNAGYNQAGRLDPNYTEIIKLENTNEGYSYNFVAQLQKEFENGFSGSIAYSYGDSKDLNSGTSSVAFSNWRFVNNSEGMNDVQLTRANFAAGSRIVGLVSYRKQFLNELLGAQISLFYNGQSGQPYSYVYNGDLNNDGSSNDVIYIPRDISEINLVTNAAGPYVTPQEQWDALDAYIENDPYLKENRGKYAERNAPRMPFTHQFDLRLLIDIGVKAGNTKNKLQLSFDIINLTSNNNYFITNQSFTLVNYLGLTDTDATAGVNFSSNMPRFTYTGGGQTNNKPYSAGDLGSRWRGQFGIRYIFN